MIRIPEEARKKLAKILDIHKKKLLIAINQTPLEAADEFTEDEKLAADTLPFTETKQWDDSKAIDSVKETLTKHATFKLVKYLTCANNLCVVFKNKDESTKYSTETLRVIHMSIEYVLTHARQFGNATKCIFKKDAQEAMDQQSTSGPSNQQTQAPQESYLDQAKLLIQELKEAYNDAKFKNLNAIATTFALIIVRRLIKQKQNKVRRLIGNLTSMKNSIEYLVVYAYLTTDDEKTKKTLYDTCVKYMEWSDMQLPYLYCKVLELYNIDAGELWDTLITVLHNDEETTMSLLKFSKRYYEIYKLTKENPPQYKWYSFCRYFDGKCERNLSDEQNVKICMVLKNLVKKKDRRVGRLQIELIFLDWAQRMAAEILKKIAK